MINIKWFGHSMWKIWNEHVSIITDPFADIGYKLPENETADIILSSHDHFDHNNFALIKGNPIIINKPGSFEQNRVKIDNIQVWHDASEGSQRGSNLLMKFTINDKIFLHCGDLGHVPGKQIREKLGKIDVIFIPIGGFYTIDAAQAKEIIDHLSPVIIFPMHYKTAVLDFPIADEVPFKKLFPETKKVESNQLTLTESDFNLRQVIFLNYG